MFTSRPKTYLWLLGVILLLFLGALVYVRVLSGEWPFIGGFVNPATKQAENHYPSKDQWIVSSDINVLENVDIPVVYAKGKLLNYEFADTGTGYGLYITFESNGKQTQIKVPHVITTKIYERFVVGQLKLSDKDYLATIFEKNVRGDKPYVDAQLIFYVLNNESQASYCLDTLLKITEDAQFWCNFISSKTYNQADLLDFVLGKFNGAVPSTFDKEQLDKVNLEDAPSVLLEIVDST